MKLRAKKGFTLVELLIVIVIIGILVGAMLLSSGGATASAKASAALSELRGMKGAVLLYMTDSAGTIPAAEEPIVATSTFAAKMDNPGKFGNGLYFLRHADNAGVTEVWVGVTVSGDVYSKLQPQATAAGLSFDAGGDANAWKVSMRAR
ncbi:hypothetical protein FACS1894204_06520 [Synergistales bacterium]|nr:hypothetical protein FACS1894204_06520 [Synergistales bacterium]